MNEFAENLAKHLIYPSWNMADERYLAMLSEQYYCQAEHHMIGSTTIAVDRPWIPYAILAKRPIEEVNQRREKAGLFPVDPNCFGFDLRSELYMPSIRLSPAHHLTLEVPEPSIVQVQDSKGKLVPEKYWADKKHKYIGPFHDVRSITTERR